MEKPTSRLISTNPLKRYIADPSPMGLFAFATITWIAATIHVGWHTRVDAALFAPAFLYGGFVQVLAGTLDMLRGEKVGGSTFIAFGVYWAMQGLIRWPGLETVSKYPSATEYNRVMGWALICWAFIALSSTLATLRTSVMQVVLMIFVTIDFTLLGFVNFFHPTRLEKVTGYFLLVTAVNAWYNGTALLLRGVSDIKLWMGQLPGTNIEDPILHSDRRSDVGTNDLP